MSPNPQENLTPYDNGSPDGPDATPSPTNYYTVSDVKTLWGYLNGIDPTKSDQGQSVAGTVPNWQSVAQTVATLQSSMQTALAKVNSSGQWTGATADLFTDVAK